MNERKELTYHFVILSITYVQWLLGSVVNNSYKYKTSQVKLCSVSYPLPWVLEPWLQFQFTRVSSINSILILIASHLAIRFIVSNVVFCTYNDHAWLNPHSLTALLTINSLELVTSKNVKKSLFREMLCTYEMLDLQNQLFIKVSRWILVTGGHCWLDTT